mgnify:CR=1 FL=1
MKRLLFIPLLFLLVNYSWAGTINTIIEVPEATEINDEWIAENPGAAYELYRLDSEWVSHIQPDTVIVGGKKLILATLNLSAPDPLTLVDGLFLAYGLPWSVVCMQSLYPDEPILVDGVEVGRQAISYKPCNTTTLYQYQQPRYDDNGVELPHSLEWTAQWAGAADWR